MHRFIDTSSISWPARKFFRRFQIFPDNITEWMDFQEFSSGFIKFLMAMVVSGFRYYLNQRNWRNSAWPRFL